MTSWHDLRTWLSGFLGALALAAFVAATLMRALERARQGEEPVLARRPVARVDVFEKAEIHHEFSVEDRKSLVVHA